MPEANQHQASSLKVCTKCGEAKRPSEFYARGDGCLRADCKACCDAIRKARASGNRDAENESRKRWKLANPDKVRQSGVVYRAENADSIKEYNAAYRKANPEIYELAL